MSDLAVIKKPVLILILKEERAIKLAVFASILNEMAWDYRRLYQSDLELREIRRGSLIAYISQIVEAVDGANHIADFAKNLRDIFGLVRDEKIRFGRERRAGMKTVRSILDVADQCDGEIRVVVEHGGQRTEYIRTTAVEARVISEHAQQQLPPAPRSATSASLPIQSMDSLAKRLGETIGSATASQRPLLEDPLQPFGELTDLIVLFLDSIRLQPGGRHVITQAAKSLREQGLELQALFLEKRIR